MCKYHLKNSLNLKNPFKFKIEMKEKVFLLKRHLPIQFHLYHTSVILRLTYGINMNEISEVRSNDKNYSKLKFDNANFVCTQHDFF